MSGTAMDRGAAASSLPRGVTPPSGRGGRFLSDVIVELGFADRETVEQALEASRAPGKKLGTTLVEMGILTEHELGRAVAERYRLDHLDLAEFEVDPEAVMVIGEQEMKRYDAVPVAFTEDGALVVAMVDPADWLAAEEIAQITRRRVRRAVASASGVAQVIEHVVGAREDQADATDETSAGGADALPARLTLRPVANPLKGRSEPASPPSVFTPSSEAAPPADPEPEAEESGLAARVDEAAPESPTPDGDEVAVEPRPLELVGDRTVPGDDEQPAPDDEQPAPDDEQPDDESLESETGAAETTATDAADPEGDEPEEGIGVSLGLDEAHDQEGEADAPADRSAAAELAEPAAAANDQDAIPDTAQTPAVPADPDGSRRDLALARAELEGMRTELDRVRNELADNRTELATTRTELTSSRGRVDTALKRATDGEREAGEAHAEVSRLEAELASEREKVQSLRDDVSWARQQIEHKDEREDQALSDLRARIETMAGWRVTSVSSDPDGGSPPPVADGEPQTDGVMEPTEAAAASAAAQDAAIADPSASPADAATGDAEASSSDVAAVDADPSKPASDAPASSIAPAPPAAAASSNGRPSQAQDVDDAGTTKARGLKRLIAAVRRL